MWEFFKDEIVQFFFEVEIKKELVEKNDFVLKMVIVVKKMDIN